MSIELDFNQISDSGALVLADSIATLTKISEISLQCNSISDSEAIYANIEVCSHLCQSWNTRI